MLTSPALGPRSTTESSRSAWESPKEGSTGGLHIPQFPSAAKLDGWDEESILPTALVIEDTTVRESCCMRHSATSADGGGSTGSIIRKEADDGSYAAGFFLAQRRWEARNVTDRKKDVTEEEDKKIVVIFDFTTATIRFNYSIWVSLNCCSFVV